MELRDIEVFLTLAEELHFGRTAERLHVTPARVSQAIKKQERRVGAPLFDRSSHHVALTPIGRQLRDDLVPAYRGLREGIDRARRSARAEIARKAAPLRLGIIGGGPLDDLRPVFDAFATRHPEHPLRIRSIPFSDPFGALRAGDLDIAVVWLPVQEPDLTVGPVLFRVPIVLAVSSRHRLAHRASVSYEDLADETTIAVDVPNYWRAAIIPRTTPSGRKIPAGPVATDWMDVTPIIANGEVVVPVHAHAVRYHARPDITYVPIRDAPIAPWAPVWSTAAETDLTRAFARAVADTGPITL